MVSRSPKRARKQMPSGRAAFLTTNVMPWGCILPEPETTQQETADAPISVRLIKALNLRSIKVED